MSSLTLMPKKRERLADQLYGQILEQIVSGVLGAGDRLPSEKQICERFGVSRPIVREALLRLQADGLVVSRQGSGSFVQRRPPQSLTRFVQSEDMAPILRCLEARIPVEGQAAALAAIRHTPSQLAAIGRALGDLGDRLASGQLAISADLAFHRAVAEASGNGLFTQMLELLHETIERSMTMALSITREGSRDRAARVLEEHRAIHDAIAAGDLQGAELAMRYHLNRSRQRITDGQRDL